MKILHTADLHVKLKQDKRYRADLITTFNFLLNTITTEAPDYVFIAGDLFDNKHPTSAERSIINTFIRKVLDTGTTIAITPGNHDTPAQTGGAHTLRPLENLKLNRLYILEDTDIYSVGNIDILAMPYIYSGTPAILDKIKELHNSYSGNNLFAIGHFWVDSYFNMQAPGTEYCISKEFLSGLQKVNYGALGHIHLGGPIVGNWYYSGSPFRCTLGEEEPSKSVIIWEDGVVRRVISPAMPIKKINVTDVDNSIYTLKNTIIRIIARGITVDMLPQVERIRERLARTNNYIYIDLDLRRMSFSTAEETTMLSLKDFILDWIKKNDLVEEKQQILSICDAIYSGKLTKDSSAFDIKELDLDDTKKS